MLLPDARLIDINKLLISQRSKDRDSALIIMWSVAFHGVFLVFIVYAHSSESRCNCEVVQQTDF